MKFDHDADKVHDVIVGHKMDKDKVMDTAKLIATDPEKAFGGFKKSQVMEYIVSNADEPEIMLAVAIVLSRGIESIAMMAMIEAKTEEAMSTMDIDPKMPEEMKEAIRKAKAARKANEGKTIEDTDDEFEQLKRKYS